MPSFKLNKKGFTLIEILMVIFLISIMAVAALGSYINSTDNFKFLAAFGQVKSALSTARSYAMTNKQQNNILPKRYGLCISATKIITFADTGDNEMQFDLTAADNSKGGAGKSGECNSPSANNFAVAKTNSDTIIADKTFDFVAGGYSMTLTDDGKSPLTAPLLVFYESGSGALTIVNANNTKSTSKYVAIKLTSKDGKFTKFLKIYQLSGLMEEDSGI